MLRRLVEGRPVVEGISAFDSSKADGGGDDDTGMEDRFFCNRRRSSTVATESSSSSSSSERPSAWLGEGLLLLRLPAILVPFLWFLVVVKGLEGDLRSRRLPSGGRGDFRGPPTSSSSVSVSLQSGRALRRLDVLTGELAMVVESMGQSCPLIPQQRAPP